MTADTDHPMATLARNRQLRQAKKARVRDRCRNHLSAGGTVQEATFGRVCAWSLVYEGWIPSARTPERMAHHLAERHVAFSTTLEFT